MMEDQHQTRKQKTPLRDQNHLGVFLEKKMLMMGMERKKMNEEEEDVFFSKLPDDLILHILSFMDTPTAAQTSILCKRFRPLWHSLPSLILPQLSPYRVLKSSHFVWDLIGTISKRTGSSLRKLCFTLDSRSVCFSERESFRKLMQRAFEKCSGELEISFSYWGQIPALDPLLSSAPKSLTSIKFINCNFESLHGLISSSPLLRELSLEARFWGIEPPKDPLRISSKSLKSLELISYSNVIIDSPMLTSLSLADSDPVSSSISTHGFISITTLAPDDIHSSHNNIPCAWKGNIHISHVKLERLVIRNCWGMVEAYIDTPHLRSFSHSGQPLVLNRFNHSTSTSVEVALDDEFSLSFCKMMPFLQPYKSCKVLTMNAGLAKGFITQHCDELFEAEVLVLRVTPRKSYKLLVESLLWMSCHVKLIKIIVESEVKSIEFKYNEVALKKACHCVCLGSWCTIRCWTHGLERVILTNFSSEHIILKRFLQKNCKVFNFNIQFN